MKAIISNQHKYFLGADNNQNIDFLAQRWAKKYVHNLQIDAEDYANNDQLNLTDIVSQAGRKKQPKYKQGRSRLYKTQKRIVSAKAWNFAAIAAK